MGLSSALDNHQYSNEYEPELTAIDQEIERIEFLLRKSSRRTAAQYKRAFCPDMPLDSIERIDSLKWEDIKTLATRLMEEKNSGGR